MKQITLREWFLLRLNSQFRHISLLTPSGLLDKIINAEFDGTGFPRDCCSLSTTETDGNGLPRKSVLHIGFEDAPLSIEIHWKVIPATGRITIVEFV